MNCTNPKSKFREKTYICFTVCLLLSVRYLEIGISENECKNVTLITSSGVDLSSCLLNLARQRKDTTSWLRKKRD